MNRAVDRPSTLIMRGEAGPGTGGPRTLQPVSFACAGAMGTAIGSVHGTSALRLQILNYHLTRPDIDKACIHTLTDKEFEHHLDMIVSRKIQVIPASDLTSHLGHYRGRAIAITFDDGCQSDLANAEKLRQKGMTATFFISSALIGEPGYLDAADIRELMRMGMSIGSHSHEHVRLTTLPQIEMVEQVRQSRRTLESVLGQPVDRFAFPGGAHTAAEVRAVREAGFRYAFGTDWGLTSHIPDAGTSVTRRHNILQGTSEHDFLALIEQRHVNWRRFMFQAKRLLKHCLPEQYYHALRDTAVRL